MWLPLCLAISHPKRSKTRAVSRPLNAGNFCIIYIAISISFTLMVRGIPCSALTSRHAFIASFIFSIASSSVFPWLTHPGTEGHSTIYIPSSSLSITTKNFILLSPLLDYSPQVYHNSYLPGGQAKSWSCRVITTSSKPGRACLRLVGIIAYSSKIIDFCLYILR